MHGWEAHALKDSKLTFVGLLPDLAPINSSADLAPFKPLPNLAPDESTDGWGARAKGVTIPNCDQAKIRPLDVENETGTDESITKHCFRQRQGQGQGQGQIGHCVRTEEPVRSVCVCVCVCVCVREGCLLTALYAHKHKTCKYSKHQVT